MARLGYVDLVDPNYIDAAAAAKNTFTTITEISALPQTIIPIINEKGKRFHCTGWGVVSDTTTPSLTLSVCYGTTATVLASTGAIALASTITNVPWRIEVDLVFYTYGTAGTCAAQGWWDIGTTVALVTHLPVPNTALATVAVDTTSAKALLLAATWSASSASNTITCWDWEVLRKN